ncbi:MFS transporter [Deinococcus yavapaiensis]|uniref:MFS transporter n=1 Tax=Deinococcus yavapaiensis TaxID=309889 RepID=UPI001FE8E216|nr:MFS transporter [Deinococcus yavapaiensis]
MPTPPSRRSTDERTDDPKRVPPSGRGGALAALALAVVLAMAPWFSAAAVLPQLRQYWELSTAQGAWLTLAVQLGFVAGALASAVFGLADRVAPRRLMTWGALIAAVSNVLLLVATPDTALGWRALTGAALALVYPPALKAMSAWFVTGRGVALGVLVGALTLGSALPHLVNGLGGVEWRVVVVCTSALAVLGSVVAARVPVGPYSFPVAVFRPREALGVLLTPAMRLTTLGYLGHMWELYAMWAWFALYFTDVLRRNGFGANVSSLAAYATFLVIAVGALGCVVGGVLGDRWGRTRLTSLAMLLSGACALTLSALGSASLPLVLAVSLVWGFWIIADSAQFSTIASEIADARFVGTALTLQLALGFSLTAVTIAAVGVWQPLVGWRPVLAFLAIGPLLGAVAMWRLGRRPEAKRIAGGIG